MKYNDLNLKFMEQFNIYSFIGGIFMEWNSINTKDDIDKLINVFGNFCDSCIKEVHYISGAYVNKDLEMNAINKKRNVTVVFQRQEKKPSTIEVIFEKISRLNLAPVDERYDCVISDVFIDIFNGEIYWAESKNFDIHNIREYDDFTWICAESIRWRRID